MRADYLVAWSFAAGRSHDDLHRLGGNLGMVLVHQGSQLSLFASPGQLFQCDPDSGLLVIGRLFKGTNPVQIIDRFSAREWQRLLVTKGEPWSRISGEPMSCSFPMARGQSAGDPRSIRAMPMLLSA
jgi:asparagine synthase (glutamine-hydrolysing)